jgi:hypothetical protein
MEKFLLEREKLQRKNERDRLKGEQGIKVLNVSFCGHKVTGSTARETFLITLSIIGGLVGGYSKLSEYSEDISEDKNDFRIRNPKSYDEQSIRKMGDHYVWFNYSNEQKRYRLQSLIEKLDLQDKFYITID